jgi:elongation factor Ts
MGTTVDAVKEVRLKTGAGMLDCKKAVEECGGDVSAAIEALKEKGLAMASKRSERAVGEGVVASYLHHNSRVGALVELNCETDFVARNEEFRQLAYDIAMHVVAASPVCLCEEDMPADCGLTVSEACLLSQPFVKDPSKSIGDLITEVIARTGENVKVGRFTRIEVGV